MRGDRAWRGLAAVMWGAIWSGASGCGGVAAVDVNSVTPASSSASRLDSITSPPDLVATTSSAQADHGASSAAAGAASIALEGDAPTPTGTAPPNRARRRRGVDWPVFLGPTGDSKSTEKGLKTPWPAAGPRIVWQRKLGEGYGIGSVQAGRYFQFDRFGDIARLDCLDAETGEPLWKYEYPTDYVDLYGYNGGPRASPVVDGDRVYIYGAEGMLHCLRVLDGSVVWKVNVSAKFGVIQNFFGVGSTPVVHGEKLIVMAGGSPEEDRQLAPGQLDRVSSNGSAIVAFDKRSGKVAYQTGDELASYSTPRIARIGETSVGLAFCRGGLLGFDPATGKVGFHFPWRARMLESVNASVPVVDKNEVFISETYAVGSALLRMTPQACEPVWKDDERKREKSFKAHWNTPILVDGYLYGCSGRNPPDAELRCIEWRTGKVQWSEPTQIRSSLLYVDGHFVCLGEYGKLQLIKVNPRRLEVVSEVVYRDQDAAGPFPPGLEPPGLLRSPCWAAPILAHGLMYVRGDDRLLCVELIPE